MPVYLSSKLKSNKIAMLVKIYRTIIAQGHASIIQLLP